MKGFLIVLSNRESNSCMLFLVTTWTLPSMVRIGGVIGVCGSIRPRY